MVHDLGIVVPDVGANGWKGQVFQLNPQVELDEFWSGCKYLVGNARSDVATTTTEFVVSQDKGIGTELVDGLSDLFTTVVVEVLSSLGAARQKVTPVGQTEVEKWIWNLSPILRNKLFFCGLDTGIPTEHPRVKPVQLAPEARKRFK